MADWQEMFEHDADGPGDDFEARVFAKIHKKKVQRKIGAGVAAMAAAGLLLVLGQPFRSAPRREPLTVQKKTEVPVSENLFFSTSDSRTRYSLQPVSQGSQPEAPAVGPNQI